MWTPLGDTALVFWGEIDPVGLPQGYSTVAGAVDELFDLNGSGLKLAQATPAKRPSLVLGGAPSGLPSLHFDPTQGQFLQATFPLLQPYHVFMSVRAVPLSTSAYYFDGVLGSCDCYTNGALHGGTNLGIHVYGGNSINGGSVAWNWERWGAVFSHDASKLKINDTITTGSLVDNSPAPGGFTLGARYNGTMPGQMDVQCVLIYSAEKTGTALGNIETYLKTKAGLAW